MERRIPAVFETHGRSSAGYLEVSKALCVGYSGRNREKVQEHIDETAALGIPAPEAVPTIYRVGLSVLSTETRVEVQGGESSGEVEFAAYIHRGRCFVTVASDHTDRKLEQRDIERSKQITPKIFSPFFWDVEDLKGQWDAILLRSWMGKNGEFRLYQQGTLEHLLPLKELLTIVADRVGETLEGCLLFSGTVPSVEGLWYGDTFRIEMHDPVRNRTIVHEYAIEALPGSY